MDYLLRERKPSKHPKMPVKDRAKQFGAFDPLTGFGEAIKAKELEVERKMEEQDPSMKSK